MTHLVIFDIDGTLVDSTGFDGEIYANALREVLGVEVDRDWSSYPHVTDSGLLVECLRRNGIEDTDGALRAAVKDRFVRDIADFIATNRRAVAEIAGARELFGLVRGDPRCRVAIATGGWRETASMKLEAAGFQLGDTVMVTASDDFDRAAIMRLASRRACPGEPPRRHTYVGDGDWDQKACALLGWDFIAIGGRVAHSPAFRDFSDRAAILGQLGLDA